MKTNWEKLLIQALVAFFGSHLDELVIFVAQFARVVSYSKQNIQVAVVGFASGTDSIGVFVPLFASTSWFPCVVFVVLFYILFILWLGLAYALVNQKNIAVAIKRYGEYIGSVLLIALGVYVIIDCGTYKLIKKI
eukprot:Phypoly_transcript_26134.p1 GENE.Phypoly_transcript_26134~~Phypoly_transcript_26134.p1  ORF type:complete len:135 (+),score=12.27 Phypoly_transcript_26134:99-503(+)